MNTVGADLIVTWYLELESRLLSILWTVNYSNDTKLIFLPPLANIVVDTCSLIDTVFREEYKGLKSSDKANIVDYRKFYGPSLALSQIKTLMYQYPPSYLVPFAPWEESTTKDLKKLIWWESYNYLKHNRIKYHKLATLETSMLALAALFQVISQMQTFLNSLVRYDLIFFGSWGKEYAKQAVFEKSERVTILAESELFATPIGSEKFPDEISAISPYRFGTGKKLWRYLDQDW